MTHAPIYQINNNRSARMPINASRGASLPAMAHAMIEAEKLRRPNVTEETELPIWVGAGQTGLLVLAPRGHPIIDKRIRADSFELLSNGALMIHYHICADGVRFGNSTKRPDMFVLQESWDVGCHACDNIREMPRFGKTAAKLKIHPDGGMLTLTLPTNRKPLVFRPLKRNKAPAEELPPQVENPLAQVDGRQLVAELNRRAAEDQTMIMEIRDGRLRVMIEWA